MTNITIEKYKEAAVTIEKCKGCWDVLECVEGWCEECTDRCECGQDLQEGLKSGDLCLQCN